MLGVYFYVCALKHYGIEHVDEILDKKDYTN